MFFCRQQFVSNDTLISQITHFCFDLNFLLTVTSLYSSYYYYTVRFSFFVYDFVQLLRVVGLSHYFFIVTYTVCAFEQFILYRLKINVPIS